ncbi:MAG: lysozyme inhibitor LprI family protein [Candidatus Acidiferrales bacterium]
MKLKLWRFAVVMLAFLVYSGPMMAQKRRPDPCKDTSHMGQQEMNQSTIHELQKAESRLDGLLKQLGIAKDSPEQKAWEAYRDAQLAALYPPRGLSSYGSVYPMCLAILKKKLTEGRIRDLNALTTSGEGDVCYGYQLPGSKGIRAVQNLRQFETKPPPG